jgi:D-arabinose 1-dehydrogenase-like Zn-dependent alcohol dehydrogenase
MQLAAPGAPLALAILFAPVGELVPAALRAVGKGGTVVCAGIHIFPLRQANEALARLREGRINGAAVLVMDEQ